MKLSIHQKAGYLRDSVFASNDGIITTFAIVAGSAGASLDSSIVLVLGFANLFADGFSMAVGNYLGVKSEIEFEDAQRKKGSLESAPFNHGLVSFLSFNLGGLVPLIPFVFKFKDSFRLSTLLVIICLFGVGLLRSFYTRKNFVKSGFENFIFGGLAALIAYLIGFFVENYVVA